MVGTRSQDTHSCAPPPLAGSRVRFPSLPRTQTHPQGIAPGVGDHFATQTAARNDIQSDGVVPTLEALRRAPSIAMSVTQLIESYEDQARASLQGRQARKSGRYNTTDVVHTTPEHRWPNEGYHAPAGKKKVAYNDLTLPQWVVGQLSNIFHMKDPTTAKHALLQVILAMKDATSLPWPVVRGAWATSMHDLQEGHLGWQDATQWSINQLSSSQISMASSKCHSHPGSYVNFLMRALAPMRQITEITGMCVHIVKDRGRWGTIQKVLCKVKDQGQTTNDLGQAAAWTVTTFQRRPQGS